MGGVGGGVVPTRSIKMTNSGSWILDSDYTEFMVESSSKSKIEKLEKLQEKAVRYVVNDLLNVMDIDVLYANYDVSPLSMRYR